MNRGRCHKRWLKRWNKAWRRACRKANSSIYRELINSYNPWFFFWEELENLKHRKIANDK